MDDVRVKTIYKRIDEIEDIANGLQYTVDIDEVQYYADMILTEVSDLRWRLNMLLADPM